MIKQVALALAALGLSMSAYAAYPSDEVMPIAPPTVNVTIPQQQGSWTIGLEGFYDEVNNGDFHYANSIEPIIVNGLVTTTDSTRESSDVDGAWGGHIDLAYNFAGDGRYVKLGYTHLTNNESTSRGRIPGGTLNGIGIGAGTAVYQEMDPTIVLPAGVNGWDAAHGRNENRYDAVDLVFGQRFDFGQKVTLDAFGGLRYASIDTRDRAHYEVLGTVNHEEGILRLKSDFDGIGPRAGFNGQVRLGSGLSIVGTFAGSLIAGELSQRDYREDDVLVNATNALVSSDIRNNKLKDEDRIVPELDARLGVNYTTAFQDTAVGLEVGYEVTHYFGARGTNQLSYVDTVNHTSDFAMQGPYVRVQVDIA